MRVDRCWKQTAAGLLAIMTLAMTGGNLDSLVVVNPQSLKAQGQMLPSPNKIIIRDEGDSAQSFQAAAASWPVIQTKARITAFGGVTTPKTDTISLSRVGRPTMMASHDTTAQLLSVTIKTGEGSLTVVDGGWTNSADCLLNQTKQKGGHVQAWLLAHPDSDHVGALADILCKHNGEITTGSTYYSFVEDNWYSKKDPKVAEVVVYIEGVFGPVPQDILHGDITSGRVIQAGPAKIQVLNQIYKVNNDFINNNSVAYMASLDGTNTVSPGGLVKLGGEQLTINHDPGALKCDIIQVVHRGQNSVGYEAYKVLKPSVALQPTPQWLWDDDSGDDSGSGIWPAQETKNWMMHLGVDANHCIKDGDQVIK